MTDHSHFEELAALEAGGLLSDDELIELREHTKVCAECRQAEEEYSRLAGFGLPLTVSPIREFLDRLKTRPDPGMRPDSYDAPGSKALCSPRTLKNQRGIKAGEVAFRCSPRRHWRPRS